MKKGIFGYVIPLSAALLLAACGSVSGNHSMYYWGGYNDAVYENLKNDDSSVGTQISKMEKYFAEAEQKHQAVAPGAHAHMGLLLIDAGQTDAAKSQFEQERQLFPESSKFIDFLLKNKSKGDKK